MKELSELLKANRCWAELTQRNTPDFFSNLSIMQTPRFLWIGCADSRVPANQIVDRQPGELFVHRNIANLVSPTDNNCLAVIQYAVDILKVRHIIVCGHYGCGGIEAALKPRPSGPIDRWLQPIVDTYQQYRQRLDEITDPAACHRALCELNVIQQVRQLGETSSVGEAWRRGQALTLHGWIYALSDGLLRDLDVCIHSASSLALTTSAAAQQHLSSYC